MKRALHSLFILGILELTYLIVAPTAVAAVPASQSLVEWDFETPNYCYQANGRTICPITSGQVGMLFNRPQGQMVGYGDRRWGINLVWYDSQRSGTHIKLVKPEGGSIRYRLPRLLQA